MTKCNIDQMTIGEAKSIAEMFGALAGKIPSKHGAIGRKCIVRTYASGVHFGEVVDVQPNEGRSRCELRDSRRLWSWSGAFTLSAVASQGVNVAGSKISTAVKIQFIEDAIEFIPMSIEAVDILEGAKSHEP